MNIQLKTFSSFIITITLLIMLVSYGATKNPSYAFATADYCMDSEEQAFLTLINNYRVQNGLSTVTASQTLGAASRFHSMDMATYNYFAHNLAGNDHIFGTSDDISFTTNMANFGYTKSGGSVGENIAGGYQSASSVFSAWKASAGHNANMLSAWFTTIGIGRAYGATSTYKWYWTTDFGGYFDIPAILCSTTATPTPTPTPGVTTTITPTITLTPIPTSTPTPAPSDTTPPTVSITNPQNNATVIKRSKVTITATASDNIAVSKVDFLVNGVLKCSSLLPPYSCVWKVPSGKTTSYTIEAKAYDAGGNTSSSVVSVKSQ